MYCWGFGDLLLKSQNAPVAYPTMLHSEQKCAHFCPEWSIVGYATGAFWDFLIRSIRQWSFSPEASFGLRVLSLPAFVVLCPKPNVLVSELTMCMSIRFLAHVMFSLGLGSLAIMVKKKNQLASIPFTLFYYQSREHNNIQCSMEFYLSVVMPNTLCLNRTRSECLLPCSL